MKITYVVLLTLGLCAAGCEHSDTTLNPAPAVASHIKYTVTGTGCTTTADITYENASEDSSQSLNATMPWAYEFDDFGGFLYVSGQNDCASGGGVTTTIYKNNVVIKTSSCTGAFCIATSSYSW